MNRPIRVLIVDDSALMRHRLGVIVGGATGFEVAGTARNGSEGLTQLTALQPDVVTLDVEMPVMDGLATLESLMRERPTPVIMVSTLTEAGAQTTLDALALGAVDYLAKPAAFSTNPANPFAAELLAKLAVAARVNVRRPQTVPRRLALPFMAPAEGHPASGIDRAGSPPAADRPREVREQRPTMVVIGSSTGGPQALDHVIGQLTPRLPACFALIQHMPPVFTRSLAARLDRRGTLAVREVAEGDAPCPGEAVVAQGGSHMLLGADGCWHLDGGPAVHGVRPAIDPTLLSLVECWTGRLLVVILTGMGVDGAAGARAVRGAGATIYAQDEATSIVYGMPRAVVQAGLATAVLPLPAIAPAIDQWVLARAAARGMTLVPRAGR